ncbi:uncharacterized protein [Spinacia oleracea]|nr:uncharacterized protein LOC130467721 isoform X3 [Spinacia oleracea]
MVNGQLLLSCTMLQLWYALSLSLCLYPDKPSNSAAFEIEEVPLFNIMNKFDGETITEVVRPQIARMRYRVTKLPPYIIVHMQRFTKNNFFVEKNPTLGLHSEDCALCEEFDVVREQWAKFFTNKYLLLALARLIELV